MVFPLPGLHGAHLRCDLLASIGRTPLDNALRSGTLRRLWARVVVDGSRWLDTRTRAAAAVLTAGPESVLAGATAAHLHGCRSVSAADTHVLVPYCHGIRSRDGLVVHHGRGFAGDAVLLDGLRLLPLDRVVADLLCGPKRTDALAVADEALRLAGPDHDRLRRDIGERLLSRDDPRGTVLAASLLDLASPRAESPPESWIRCLLLDAGFPVPEVNWSVLAPDGRERYRIDLAWPLLRIALEYDGREFHAGREEEDAARQEELERRGWIVVRVDVDDLRDLDRVKKELRAAFHRRGYCW